MFTLGNKIISGSFGDIYKCIENSNVLIKVVDIVVSTLDHRVVKFINHNHKGEVNDEIIKIVNKSDFLMKIHGYKFISPIELHDVPPHGMFSLGRYHIFMENVGCTDLFDFIDSNIPTDVIFKIMEQCLLGLECLHTNDIIHRDIKPENIRLDNDNNIKIIDFGLSRKGVPCTGAVGTTGYFAPEFDKEYDTKFDIWSIGCVFYSIIYCEDALIADSDDPHQYVYQLKNRFKPYYPKSIFINFLKHMIKYDPTKRLGATSLLRELKILKNEDIVVQGF